MFPPEREIKMKNLELISFITEEVFRIIDNNALTLQAGPRSPGDLVVVRSLDREEMEKYSFKAIAYDGGNPSRTSTVQVNIEVLDTNDNSHVF